MSAFRRVSKWIGQRTFPIGEAADVPVAAHVLLIEPTHTAKLQKQREQSSNVRCPVQQYRPLL